MMIVFIINESSDSFIDEAFNYLVNWFNWLSKQLI